MRPPAVQSRPAPRFVGANHIKAFMASFWHIRVSTSSLWALVRHDAYGLVFPAWRAGMYHGIRNGI